MATGYCEREHVRRALQEATFDGAIDQDPDIVRDAITGFSQWLRRQTRRHWYDSNGQSSDIIPTGVRSASDLMLDVPASPHRQGRQLHHGDHHATQYPVTHAGPYCRVRLPHYDVATLNTLEVRDRGGGVTDWVSNSDFTSGRGEDYYLKTEGDEWRTSYLYLHAGTIGPRVDFTDLLTVGYDYGSDQQDHEWNTVRRSVAMLVAADLVLEEDVQSLVPDNGQLTSVQTKAERYVQRALDRGLDSYMEVAVE